MKASLRSLVPPPSPPPRHTRRPLPAYRHLPGLTPHPVRHPQGHSYGAQPEPVAEGARDLPQGWYRCRDYLFGVDLFNRAYFWEAHEAWEGVWHAVGHETIPGHFLQGLIQTSAALLKDHLEVPGGVRTLLTTAGEHLDQVEDWLARTHSGDRYMGLLLAPWRREVAAYLATESRDFPFIRLEGD